ncbi:NAD(P)H-hydrate dehydratase [Neisseriaceae bacterium B1]
MFETLPKPIIDSYKTYAVKQYPSLVQPRAEDSHKGTFGTVGIVGGTEGMVGAPLMAGTAALYAGCGKVVVGFNYTNLPLAVYADQPELILQTAAQIIKWEGITSWLLGCGLGRNEAAARALHAVWNSAHPQLVLDADALHLLVEHPKLFPQTKRADLVLTPHPGEAAHLLDTSINQVQSNRAWAAREIASRYRCWVVLKGYETVISSARGFLHVNETGNTGLATAGSGDVLAGVITSLLAQGIDAEEAVPAAVWLHGAAAELLTKAQQGPIGLTASELPAMIRWLRNQLMA